jgi:hypothetical protein
MPDLDLSPIPDHGSGSRGKKPPDLGSAIKNLGIFKSQKCH